MASVPEYASHRGVSPQAVRKAIKDGRLRKSVGKAGRQVSIDIDLADREWAINTQGTMARPADVINAGKAAAQGKPFKPSGQGQSMAVEVNYSRARAIREQFAAKMAELEYREKAEQLCRVDEVRTATFKTIRLFRDAVQNIPIRVVNELAAIVGDVPPEKRHEMMMVMQREINRALEQMADSHGPR